MNTPYGATMVATGGKAPYSWSSADLPRNLVINPSTGAISGTPVNFGTTRSTSRHRLVEPRSDSHETVPLVIANLPLAVSLAGVPTSAVTNSFYSAQPTASGGLPSYNWSATGLPAGIFIDNQSGLISGTPTLGAVYPITVTVTDAVNQTASASYNLTVAGSPGGTISVASVNVGQNLQAPITITLNPPPAVAVQLTISSNNPSVVLW